MLWDYRGHGRSQAPRDPAAYSMQQVVDDLGRVLDWGAGGTPAVLGGLSFGGLASLHFALREPARVRALLLIDTGPGFKNPEAQARWEAQVERTAGFLEARGCQAFVESKAAATAIGLRPELPAAQAAARAIAAQDPAGLALFARRVAAVAPPVIDQLAVDRDPGAGAGGREGRAVPARRRGARVAAAEGGVGPHPTRRPRREPRGAAGVRRGRARLPGPHRRRRPT